MKAEEILQYVSLPRKILVFYLPNVNLELLFDYILYLLTFYQQTDFVC